jgi:hypothetical protein
MISRFVKKPVNAWTAHETNNTFVIGVCHIHSLLRSHRIVQRNRKVGEVSMGDLVGNKRTAEREVDGITFDMRSDGTVRHRFHKIVFRITKDEIGKSISLCDELRGIMIKIPLEPVEDLL